MTRNAKNRILPISAMKPQTVKAISYPHNDFRDSERPQTMPDKPNVVSKEKKLSLRKFLTSREKKF